MRWSELKWLYISLIFVATIIFVAGRLLNGIKPRTAELVEEVEYEMPRPKEFQAEGILDFSGRAIERLFRAVKRSVFGECRP